MFLYTIITCAGYLSFGKDTPSLVILRKGLPNISDLAMTLVHFGLTAGLLVGIGVRVTCLKDTLRQFIFGRQLEQVQMTKIGNFIYSLFVILIPLMLAVLVNKNILSIISFITSILCPFFIIIFPSLMAFKMKKKLGISSIKSTFIVIFMVVFSSILFFSIVINGIALYKGEEVIG